MVFNNGLAESRERFYFLRRINRLGEKGVNGFLRVFIVELEQLNL